MIRIPSSLSIFLTLLVFIGKLSGQEDPGMIESRLRYDIGALAHDSMLGREAGTPSEIKAVRYIESSFRSSGLKPAPGYPEQYLREFRFGHYQYLKGILKVNGIGFLPGEDFGALASSSDGEINNLKIIRMNQSGINHQGQLAYQDCAVLIDLKAIPGNKHQLASVINSVTEEGATAVLLYNAPRKDFKHRLFNPDSLPGFKVPVLYITAAIINEIEKSKHPVCDIHVKIKRERATAYNVIGFLDRGSPWTVVVGSHYDHVGVPGKLEAFQGDPGIHNGADDNASGTAAVMELARWASPNKELKYNYLFIAFSAEEKGLFGSWNFCNSSEFSNYGIRWMLNLDMVGRLGWNHRNKLTALGTASSPNWNRLVKHTEHHGFRISRIKGAPGFSDHYPFMKHRVPVIFLNTGLHHDYHTPLDDPDRINYAGETRIIQYCEHLIMNVESIGDPGFRKISGFYNFTAAAKEFIFR